MPRLHDALSQKRKRNHLPKHEERRVICLTTVVLGQQSRVLKVGSWLCKDMHCALAGSLCPRSFRDPARVDMSKDDDMTEVNYPAPLNLLLCQLASLLLGAAWF